MVSGISVVAALVNASFNWAPSPAGWLGWATCEAGLPRMVAEVYLRVLAAAAPVLGKPVSPQRRKVPILARIQRDPGVSALLSGYGSHGDSMNVAIAYACGRPYDAGGAHSEHGLADAGVGDDAGGLGRVYGRC